MNFGACQTSPTDRVSRFGALFTEVLVVSVLSSLSSWSDSTSKKTSSSSSSE